MDLNSNTTHSNHLHYSVPLSLDHTQQIEFSSSPATVDRQDRRDGDFLHPNTTTPLAKNPLSPALPDMNFCMCGCVRMSMFAYVCTSVYVRTHACVCMSMHVSVSMCMLRDVTPP